MKHQTVLPNNSAIFNFHFNFIFDCTKTPPYYANKQSDLKKMFLMISLTVLIGMSVAVQFYYNTFKSYFKYITLTGTEALESVNYSLSCNHLNTFPDDIRTYKWFKSNRHNLENLGKEEEPNYSKSMPVCHLNVSTLGPISVNKTELKLKWVEEQYPEIRSGGFYAPMHCRPRHRVAILVPFRNREKNLIIFLYHMHKFLKKQLLLYRVFVVEQYGNDKFNKGALYNVGYIVSRQFGPWHCLIFHDVDLLPLNEKIFYSCPRLPTHMSSAVESFGYKLPYEQLFGGVTALTPRQYKTVNGYSNCYWNWGAEDDDMFIRLQARRYPVLRYSKLIGRYATLPHEPSNYNLENSRKLYTAKKRYQTEGLKSLEFKIKCLTKKKLFAHILTDINPRGRPT